MRKLLRLSTLLLAIFTGTNSYTQDFSNKGKEFWLCFPQHVPSGSNLATLSIWITSDKASSGTITMSNGAFSANFSIVANGLQEIQVPHWAAHISNAESGMVIKKSIKVKVNPGQPPVVAYAQQWGAARSAATLLLPTNVLGKRYYAVSFTQDGVGGGSYEAKSQFQIIATKPNTEVKVTPRLNGVVGVPFTISLPLAGDMYQYQADLDITGTLIESIASGTGGCLPIAVFSGSSNITIGSTFCSGGTASYDPLFQQQYPISTWGKNFGFVPFADYPNGSACRVLASEDNTSVYYDGTLVATLMAGQIYPSIFTNSPDLITQAISITADKPICVAQYAPRQFCGGANFGDPDMVILNPIEQNIRDITIFSSSQQAITRQWINVLIKTIAIPSFRINGAAPFGGWQAIPSLPGYSYLRQLLNGPGSYRLSADSGFNAIAYGFSSNFESYAYSAGTNVKDLYTQLGIATPYGSASSPSVCLGSPSTFKISLPYRPDSMYWDFHGAQSPNVLVNSPTPIPYDSTTFINGKQLWWYSLPTPYYYNTTGTFQVTVTTYAPAIDGCGSEQEIDFDLEVYPKPVADFNFSSDGCLTSPVLFTENSNPGGRSISKRYWNFGDANTSTATNPSHSYLAPGLYNVKHSYITDIGCLADTISHIVTLNNPPVAQFSVATPTCEDTDITFTDQSTASAGGTLSQWTWDFGDGSPVVIRSSSTNEVHRFAAAGTYNVTLKVETSSGCASTTFSLPVTIHPKPVVDFPLPTACLPAGAAQFNDQSTVTGPGNTINAWSWDFGDGGTSTLQNPAHNYASTGPFSVALTVTTNNGCTDTRTQQLTTVFAEPVAAFNNLPEVCIGSLIGFSDASTAAGSTVTGWTWDFGDGSPVSHDQNPTHIYATAGTYTISLRVSTAAGCATVNNIATHTVVVKPLPTATITGDATVCLNAPAPNIVFTGANGTAPFHFIYTINGGPSQVAIAGTGNTVSLPVPSTTAGTFIYTLTNVQETATTGCAQNQTGSATVTVKALPTASITGATTVCKNAASPSISFSGNNGTAPYTFGYKINGGAVQTVTTVSGNSVTVPVPTGTAGSFTYELVSVQEGSANLCSQAQTGSAVVIVKDLPTASISGGLEVCLNSPSPDITFTGAGGTAPYTFRYTINGGPVQTISGTSGNSVILPVPTAAAGTFIYSLVDVTETGSSACSQAQGGTTTVMVNPLPAGNFNFTIPSCETRNISFSDLSSANAGALNNWQWDFGDPGSGTANTAATQNPVHTYTAAGDYTVSLVVSSDKGCVSPAFTRTVTIHARPLAGFISPEVCLTDPFAPFIDTSRVAAGSIVAWEWNFGDPNANAGNPNTSVLQHPFHRYSVVGPYTVQLIATSNNGCQDTVRQAFVVNGSIPVSGFVVQQANSLCSNAPVSVKDASTVDFGNIIKVEVYWDYLNNPADKTTDDIPTAGKVYTHTYPEFGSPFAKTYQVRYVAYSGINCVNTSVQTITVLATPTLSFDPIPFACTSAPAFQITQAQLLNGIPGTGLFSGNGVSTTGMFSPSAGAGQYQIRYTYTATNGCTNYKEQTLNIYSTPAVNAGPDKFVLEGGQVTLTPALNASVPVTYQWAPPAGLDNATSSFPVASPEEDMTYTLTVTSPQGCKASDAVFVKVLKKPSIPNIFSPNGDGVHDRWVIPYLESYPGCTIDVVNRYGQPVFHSVGYATPWDGKINGKEAPVGTYYYVIDPKNGRSKMAGYVDIIR
ncbi:MAG: PKD domain-containing protein [Sphingobacteriales bacterium]|nr:PKD domain-containing protein [Sphingobacteriales bacterium]